MRRPWVVIWFGIVIFVVIAKDRITRSTVVITDEIRENAKRFLAEWTA